MQLLQLGRAVSDGMFITGRRRKERGRKMVMEPVKLEARGKRTRRKGMLKRQRRDGFQAVKEKVVL